MTDPAPERVMHQNAGTVAYVIKHARDDLYWSQYGWSPLQGGVPVRALRFPLAGDAQYLIDRDQNLKGAKVQPHTFADDVRDPHAATDYDPFHIRA
jgi:hypothetical protein